MFLPSPETEWNKIITSAGKEISKRLSLRTILPHLSHDISLLLKSREFRSSCWFNLPNTKLVATLSAVTASQLCWLNRMAMPRSNEGCWAASRHPDIEPNYSSPLRLQLVGIARRSHISQIHRPHRSLLLIVSVAVIACWRVFCRGLFIETKDDASAKAAFPLPSMRLTDWLLLSVYVRMC